jgi:hypothetical protein
MLELFIFFLVLGTIVFLGAVCGLMLLAYRRRQSRRAAPPTLWGVRDDDFIRVHARQHPAHHRLIATIGYADRSKLITRN